MATNPHLTEPRQNGTETDSDGTPEITDADAELLRERESPVADVAEVLASL